MSDWLGNLGSRWQKAVRDVKEQLQGPGPDMTLHTEVYIGEHRLGTLTTTDSADFRAVLAAAKSQDKPVAGEAIRDRDACGAWALHVYRPELT